jgi:hypothetical protein
VPRPRGIYASLVTLYLFLDPGADGRRAEYLG